MSRAQANINEDKRRRPSIVAGAFGPAASNSSSSLAFALRFCDFSFRVGPSLVFFLEGANNLPDREPDKHPPGIPYGAGARRC